MPSTKPKLEYLNISDSNQAMATARSAERADRDLLIPFWRIRQEISTYSDNSEVGRMVRENNIFMDLEEEPRTALNGLNRAGIASLLRKSGNAKALFDVKQIHRNLSKLGYEEDIYIMNLVMEMYGKCASSIDVCDVFEKLKHPNIYSWTILLAALTQHGNARQASLSHGKFIHAQTVYRNFEHDIVFSTALVNMYARWGNLEDAQKMFDCMLNRNQVSWNALIAAHGQHKHVKQILLLFNQMMLEQLMPDRATFVSLFSACANEEALAEGKWVHAHVLASRYRKDENTETAILNMYIKCANLQAARELFDKMRFKNVVTWNTMISAYVQFASAKEAVDMFQCMQKKGIKPNEITFSTIISALAIQSALAKAKQIHTHIVSGGFEDDDIVGNALINLYGKCGSLDHAWNVFCKMRDKNVVSWSAMIACYAQHGQANEALHLFKEMQLQGVRPNRATFSNILSACSHAGLLNEGCHQFVSVSGCDLFNLEVDHFTFIIDLLGRAGYLDGAEDLIKNTPFQPTSTLWRSLLNGCRIYMDIERGKFAAEKLLELNPRDHTGYILLSNIYATVEKWICTLNLHNQNWNWDDSDESYDVSNKMQTCLNMDLSVYDIEDDAKEI